MKKKDLLLIVLISIILPGCKKLVQVSPPSTSIADNNVYTSDVTAIAVLNGIYEDMSAPPLIAAESLPSLSLFAGLSADELTLWSRSQNAGLQAYYKDQLSAADGSPGSEYWPDLYSSIYSCNIAIEGLNGSRGLTPAVKQQLMGEAFFMRAFLYFYLVNLFGDVPLALTGNYEVNSRLPREDTGVVYAQIVVDLQTASSLLSPRFVDGSLTGISSERVRPTKWAAQALLARVYLYMGYWSNAEQEADSVIVNTGLFGLSSLSQTFLRAGLGNKEAIWQLQPVNVDLNTEDAVTFILPLAGPAGGSGVYLSQQLLSSFERGDQRRVSWVDSVVAGGVMYYYPYKYKINAGGPQVDEYPMMLRLAEVYLVRSEARAELGNLPAAAADLDLIRARAGLGPTSAVTEQDLLTAILHERQVELFTEMGHRWLDLKRTGHVDPVMSVVTPLKGGGNWQSYQQLYPLPAGDIQSNPALTQNSGY